jgi:hypothetical protein
LYFLFLLIFPAENLTSLGDKDAKDHVPMRLLQADPAKEPTG